MVSFLKALYIYDEILHTAREIGFIWMYLSHLTFIDILNSYLMQKAKSHFCLGIMSIEWDWTFSFKAITTLKTWWDIEFLWVPVTT